MSQFTSTEQGLIDINVKLRGELAALKRRAESDEGGDTRFPKPRKLPGQIDEDDDQNREIDPATGKIRRKKKAAADEAAAGDDEIPNDTSDAPNTSGALNTILVNAKIFALAVVNAGRARRGTAPLTRLVQDETVLPGGAVPRDPEQFARAVINAARKARAQSPLAPGEFISIRTLRGGRL
jgi:hypothetical protein